MPKQPSFDNLANRFIGRYFQDYDCRYSIKNPLDQAIYSEVITIIKEVYPYIMGFSLEIIYDFVQKNLLERKKKEARVNLLVLEKNDGHNCKSFMCAHFYYYLLIVSMIFLYSSSDISPFASLSLAISSALDMLSV